MEPTNDKLLVEAFAKVLRLERRKAGFSQEELAHLAGTSLRYISLLENCKHQPSLSTIKGLCDGLGIKMTDLISALEVELG
ncbi:MAG: helix-turn-helix transcriptional regulator [Pseudomonadota bacterium]